MSEKNFADALGSLGWCFERGHKASIAVTGPGGIGCVVDKVANVARMIPEEVLFALAADLQREHTTLRAAIDTVVTAERARIAEAMRGLVRLLDLPDAPQYPGDDRHTEKRILLTLANATVADSWPNVEVSGAPAPK